MAESFSWTAPVTAVAANEWPAEGGETAFLRLCGSAPRLVFRSS